MSEIYIISVFAKRFGSNCKVSLSNGEELEISIDLVNKYYLSKGKVLDDSILKNIIAEQRIYDIKKSALAYASYKPRTVKQVKTKLRDKEYNNDEIDIAIKFLFNFNLLDDEKFAFNFLKDFLVRKSAGKSKIKMELYRRGVPDYIIEDTIHNHFPENNSLDLARKSAEKKLRMLQNKPPEKQKNSLASYLQRNGYDWDIIKTILNENFDN
jgi:regulatory protein